MKKQNKGGRYIPWNKCTLFLRTREVQVTMLDIQKKKVQNPADTYESIKILINFNP
jgi:hypothetical protein